VVQGYDFIYLDANNQPCIDVKTDVTLTLTNGTASVTLDGSNFTVLSGDCATPAEASASMSLFNGNEDVLALTFIRSAENVVSLSLLFTVSPNEYFPGVPTTSKGQY
jgi:hypothetical protein